MKITRNHVTYYQKKRTPDPLWAYHLPDLQHPNVHDLINSQAPLPRRNDANNTMYLLRLVKKREGTEGVLDMLTRMATGRGGCSKRRASYARKWLKKIRRGQSESKVD
ncbi:MAG: hypothetical protein KAJ73_00780 [Zetaproteobacteria bacterium]|nr:hypothetical protein [Zetaproteobacteria bacterium]